MSTWTDTIPINLGPAYAGILADLRAQRFDVQTGSDIGSAITSGFLEFGNGNYTLYTSFDSDDGTQQGVKLYDVDDPSTVLGVSVSAEATASGGSSSASVVITPIIANATNPRYATKDLPAIAQGSAPTEIWTVVDTSGTAVNLSGKDIRFVAYTRNENDTEDIVFDDTLTPAFKYETGGDGITVGGTSNNQITLQHDATKTADAGDFRYFLWNITDNIVLAKGKVPIEPAVDDV